MSQQSSRRAEQRAQMLDWMARFQSPEVATQYPQEGPEDDAESEPESTSNESSNFETALQKERESRKTLESELAKMKRQLSAYNNIDPEIARKAQDLIAQSEQEAERQAKREAELKASYEQQYQPQLEAAKQEALRYRQAYLDYTRDTYLERAFYESDGLPNEFEPCAIALQRRVKIEEDGSAAKVTVLNKDGKPDFVSDGNGGTRPKTIRELVEELKKDPDYTWFARHFRGMERSGLGVNGDGAGVAGDPSLQGLSGWDLVTAMREKNAGR